MNNLKIISSKNNQHRVVQSKRASDGCLEFTTVFSGNLEECIRYMREFNKPIF